MAGIRSIANVSLVIAMCLASATFTLFFTLHSEASSAAPQHRDYLTTEEIELVRDAQAIDSRIEVLVTAIDRRMVLVTEDSSDDGDFSKLTEKWGDVSNKSRDTLVWEIEKIIQKAVDDVDDVAANQEMNERVLQDGAILDDVDEEITKYKIKLNRDKFPAAVHDLADAARRYIVVLEPLKQTMPARRASLSRALENCELIIEASGKIERPAKSKKKKRKRYGS